MKLKIISLKTYLTSPILKSFNITRSNGVKLIVVKTDTGIFIVDTENDWDYSGFTL